MVQTIGNEDILTSLANSSENTGSLHQIAFSSNGYQFATAWQGSSVVKLFDLRKTEQNFDPVDITMPPIEGADEEQEEESGVTSISFDAFGGYLLAA